MNHGNDVENGNKFDSVKVEDLIFLFLDYYIHILYHTIILDLQIRMNLHYIKSTRCGDR